MKKIKILFISFLTLGKTRQTFLGANWIYFLLSVIPEKYKRRTALEILALSPHYFYKDINSNYKYISHKDFLEAEYQRNLSSRNEIASKIIKPYISNNYTVLDYGCGPGFLAKAVSNFVKKVYACDISKGVITCAKIINNNKNLDYIILGEKGELTKIPKNTVDLIYSFAVIQHVTDEAFRKILNNSFSVLKDGGTAIFHIIVENNLIPLENELSSKKSLINKVKFEYGLNIFNRKKKDVVEMIESYGFIDLKIIPVLSICKIDDDIIKDNLFIVRKEQIIHN